MEANENIKRLLAKPLAHLTKYFPSRIKNVNEKQLADRRLMWQYKDGAASEQVAQMAIEYIKAQYGTSVKDCIFACIPASSAEKNELRYKDFSNIVCHTLGMVNAYEHIKVEGGRIALHEQNRKKRVRTAQTIAFDETFFRGANVILWDDCITTGQSWALVADKLEQFGANVICGLFLGRTSYRTDKP